MPKIGVTKQAKPMQPKFAWQPRFHEHIIRSEEPYFKITQYVQSNLLNWQEAKYHVNSADAKQ
jgi:putative transposase